MQSGHEPRFSQGTLLLTHSWDQTQPWEDCSLPGGLLCAGKPVCEGGDSCFVSQEKLKPGFLKEIPEKIKLFSEFLGKRPWFAGDKVSWTALGAG